jgi:tetratricopeptide (TPR) repeat protein
MLELPGVTLCCIDTQNHALALRALKQSAAQTRFARSLFITDRELVEPGVEIRVIAPLASRDAYSEFVLKSLLRYIGTAHVLLVQWDGHVVNPAAWDPAFLDCDYVGAKWFWAEEGKRVGNGGFSLRSRRLLEALQDPRIHLVDNEDVTIGRAFRPLLELEHGIRFADEALAERFSFEAAYPIGMPFGFHGLFNFSRVVDADELTELVGHFTQAIARSPQLLQLGRNCLAMQMWRPAAAVFRRILDEAPGHSEAAASLATAEANAAGPRAAGRNDPCPCGSGKRYKNCHGALAPFPTTAAPPATSIDARVRQALALHQRGDAATAESIYREVLAMAPDHPQAQHFLGVTHYQRGELDAALPLLQRSVAAVPSEPEFHNNLGLALAAADREAEAIAAYRATLALKADHSVAWNNLGLALQSVNDVAGAIAAFRRALEITPEFAQAHWNLALALLLDGQFSEGWSEYDWRLKLAELGKGRHVFPGPAWDGTAPAGKTLLIYAEQGLGDALQFARYLTLVADAGARCIVHCREPLRPLLASVLGIAEVASGNGTLPPYDAHLALLSLPRVFGTTQDTIPARVPYLAVPSALRSDARALLDACPGLKGGLCWAGSGAHPRDRSCPLALMSALFDVPDIDWFSLQQGEASAEIASAPGADRMAPLPSDAPLVATAALIAELDLVITIDTSIAHLAGALGKQVWVMLRFAPDWRWQLDRDDSLWYPTMRLFRQPRPRDWPSVVTRLVDGLQALQRARR